MLQQCFCTPACGTHRHEAPSDQSNCARPFFSPSIYLAYRRVIAIWSPFAQFAHLNRKFRIHALCQTMQN